MKCAVILHGKIGTLSRASSSLKEPQPHQSEVLIRKVHRSIKKHLIHPNDQTTFDFFIHSWNPDNSLVIDSLYKPVQSQHDHPIQEFSPQQSQIRSLTLALRFKKECEIETEHTYKYVFMFRHDLVFSKHLQIADLPSAPLIFPRHCCRSEKPVRLNRTQAWVADYCRVSHFIGPRRRPPYVQYNMYFMDWFAIASSKVADTFAHIDTHFKVYNAKLSDMGIHTRWMHFLWAYHTHFVLNATEWVQFHLLGGIDYKLARHPPFMNVGDAKVSLPPPDPAWTLFSSARRMCPYIGRIIERKP